MRAAGDAVGRQADLFHDLVNAALALGGVILAVDAQRLLQNPAHGIGGVEGAVRVLKDHLRALGVVDDLAGVVADEAEDVFHQRGLARAGLADQTQDLAAMDFEAHIKEHVVPSAAAVLVLLAVPAIQMFDFQYQIVHGSLHRLCRMVSLLQRFYTRTVNSKACMGWVREEIVIHSRLVSIRSAPRQRRIAAPDDGTGADVVIETVLPGAGSR